MNIPAMPVRELTCARCGAGFACGNGGRDGRCWCADEEFRLPMPAPDQGDCLCPSCLRLHAKQFAMSTQP